jgi:hypothetical protein
MQCNWVHVLEGLKQTKSYENKWLFQNVYRDEPSYTASAYCRFFSHLGNILGESLI